MKKSLFFALMILVVVSASVFGQDWVDIDSTVVFVPDTVLVIPFGEAYDYVYVIGTVEDGTRVACQVGGKPPKSDLSTVFIMDKTISINDTVCRSVTDITGRMRMMEYRLYVKRWRGVPTDKKSNNIMKRLAALGVKYVIVEMEKSGDKEGDRFVEIPPVTEKELNLIVDKK